MASKFWDKETELFSEPKGRDTLKVHECEKNGKAFINIREYYTDAEGELKPGSKGISIPKETFLKIIQSIAVGK